MDGAVDGPDAARARCVSGWGVIGRKLVLPLTSRLPAERTIAGRMT
jgi:hypothetical protein